MGFKLETFAIAVNHNPISVVPCNASGLCAHPKVPLQVARARELRQIVTSLGPAYIKLGQALSIRPDILSPAAMNELQKLCDKVPSFEDEIAMQVIQDELGAPWQQVRPPNLFQP